MHLTKNFFIAFALALCAGAVSQSAYANTSSGYSFVKRTRNWKVIEYPDPVQKTTDDFAFYYTGKSEITSVFVTVPMAFTAGSDGGQYRNRSKVMQLLHFRVPMNKGVVEQFVISWTSRPHDRKLAKPIRLPMKKW